MKVKLHTSSAIRCITLQNKFLLNGEWVLSVHNMILWHNYLYSFFVDCSLSNSLSTHSPTYSVPHSLIDLRIHPPSQLTQTHRLIYSLTNSVPHSFIHHSLTQYLVSHWFIHSVTYLLHGAGYYLKSWLSLSL